MKSEIEIKQKQGYYEVWFNGEFYCSCDPDEVTTVIAELEAREKEELEGKHNVNNGRG